MTPILVDTSVWVHFFRKGGPLEVQEAVRDALLGDSVWTCWPVRTELLVGARDQRGWNRLSDLLSELPEIELDRTVWEGAARLGFLLRRKGLTVPLADLLIAETARRGHCTLWHADRHFEQIRNHVDLETRAFLP